MGGWNSVGYDYLTAGNVSDVLSGYGPVVVLGYDVVGGLWDVIIPLLWVSRCIVKSIP